MIQIDIEMPKCCDVCMFSQWSNLSQTASCKLKDYEPCFADFSKEYRSKRASFCPLHEVSNNSPELDKENGELISRQDAIEHLKKRLYESALNNDGIASYTFEEIADNRIQIWMDELPPSPSRQKDGKTMDKKTLIDNLIKILPENADITYATVSWWDEDDREHKNWDTEELCEGT